MIEFDIYNPAVHLEQVIDLEKILWEGKTTEEIRNIFLWKYPAVSDLANAFVALDGNRVVGFRGFFIQDYIKDGRIFPVAVLGDAAVHPHYQRQGIFSNLTKKAIEYYSKSSVNYILALSSNTKSSPGYLKMGWKPFLHKEYRIGVSMLNMCLGRSTKQSTVKLQGCEIEIVDFSNIDVWARELDAFCQSIDGKHGISLRRNYHYWTWRFANPDWNVAFAIMRRNGKINGVIAFLSEVRRGIKVIRILDAVVENPSLFPVLYKGLKKMTHAWCYFILAATSIPNGILKKIFPFSRCSKTNTPADFYLIKTLDDASFDEADKSIELNYSNID